VGLGEEFFPHDPTPRGTQVIAYLAILDVRRELVIHALAAPLTPGSLAR
jgi:hypothetical protein